MKRLRNDSACLRVLRALKDAATSPYGNRGVTAVRLAHPSIGGLEFGRRVRNLKAGEYDGKRHRITSEREPGKKYHRYFYGVREVT